MKRFAWLVCALVAACGDGEKPNNPADGQTTPDAPTSASLQSIKNVVVIYAENRGFDNIYGNFPNANGLPVAPTTQVDRDGAVLTKLPKSWTGVTSAGFTPAIAEADSDNLPNAPYSLPTHYAAAQYDNSFITRDLYHRFYENQMQIDGGANDMFAAYADSGGLVMGYNDGSAMALWKLASEFTLADNFFMGAFGGSFLNHQYLICACAPEYPNADTSVASGSISTLKLDAGKFTPYLTETVDSPPSALTGIPKFTLSGNLTPKSYFGDNTWRAVNTMQPPYQPSANAAAAADTSKLYADTTKATTLPPQTQKTIGDQLTDKSVTWAWYSGAWQATLTEAMGAHNFPFPLPPGAVPNFQFHHQPFNYFASLAPGVPARAEHLRDGGIDGAKFIEAIDAGTLPQVSFYKPQGSLNEHPGYADVLSGDQHVADLVAHLENSPQWGHMFVVITYDENGGFWDHVAPPRGDRWGPGTRIPTLIVSPYAKKGFVDHTLYDTTSMLRLITRRFDLPVLSGLRARDEAMSAAGGQTLGDLTGSLDFGP